MRSVSQIYSEAVTIRNNYLQLTELNSGRSNSKLSMLNLITYVVAVCIHTYEVVLDLFQVRLAQAINGRINGTPDWYVVMAKKFQFNNVTGLGDELVFNEDTIKIEYTTIDTSHRIIEAAAWQIDDTSNSLLLKVSKANTNSNEVNHGIPHAPLTDGELTAFKKYIKEIKFVGANVEIESLPGDIITIIADRESPIFYDDSYITANQALDALKESLIAFANELEYNGLFYYQAVLDALRKTDNITDIGSSIRVYLQSYNPETHNYNEPVELIGRTRLKSGFIRFLDAKTASTINTDNLTLVPASRMDEYYETLDSND